MLIVGPNAGYSFSFCRDELRMLCYLAVAASGSQFRSRDLLPDVLPGLIADDPEALAGHVPRERIPPVPDGVIAYIDGYGNLKTTLRDLPGPSGSRVLVRIGEISATAIVSDGTFAVAEGELALAPGSSGWTTHSGHQRRFHELFLRGGSAAQRFAGPTSGTAIEVQQA